jgi:HK97 family phage portal protein
VRLPFVKPRTAAAPEPTPDETRSSFAFGGIEYALGQTLVSTGPVDYPYAYGDIAVAFRSNPVVFALCDLRMKALSEVRFQWNRLVGGRPSGYFGGPELLALEQPWPGGTTRSLVTQMVQDIDLAGNAYIVRSGAGVERLRPDWVEIIFTTSDDNPQGYDARVIGYRYTPGGLGAGPSRYFLAEEVCHWMPTPDPAFRHRGISWVTAALASVAADAAISDYTSRFFENGCAVSMVLTMPAGMNEEAAKKWHERFIAKHGTPETQHKPLFLANGATATPVGVDPQSAEMKLLQGAGETRVCAAAGVPPVIAGFSEGLSSTSYAAYDAARRRFADLTLTPLLGSLADALSVLLTPPGGDGAYLAFDPRDIAHFQQDTKDAAEIQAQNAATISTLFMAGYTPESVVEAVTTGELIRLKHTGATSAQVTPTGGEVPAATTEQAA